MEDKRGVEALYNLIDTLKIELESNPFCNKVTIGTLTEIDLRKQTIFPLAHITLNDVTHNDNSLTFSITIVNVDIVNVSKDITQEYYGNDNLFYVLTNQLFVINKLVSRLKEADIFSYHWQLDGNPVSTVINKELENMLAGYETTFSVSIPNTISKC
jgi:hypothetical protein